MHRHCGFSKFHVRYDFDFIWFQFLKKNVRFRINRAIGLYMQARINIIIIFYGIRTMPSSGFKLQ